MTEIRKHLDFSIQKKNIDDEGIRIEGFASTDDVDRVGDVIPASAWDLSNYEKNQIILFNHNYDEPIGKAEEVEVRDNGLYIKCLIDPQTKAGRQIENDVLKSFSVGFLLKDAKYDSNTNTFVLTDVELLEVSVVSVPANPAATFSLEKSCDDNEFMKLVKKFGQSEPKAKGVDPEELESQQMTKKVEPTNEPKAPEPNPMDALASTLEKTFERFEQRMEEKLKAVEPTPEPTPAPTVKEVDTGAERLMADIEKKFENMQADTGRVIDELKGELAKKAEEIEKMNDSKRRFPGGGTGKMGDLSDEDRKDLLHAHMFGVITGKGMGKENKLAQRVIQKHDIDPVDDGAALMDDTIQSQIRMELEMNLRAAALFERITVTSGATTLPVAGDVAPAKFQVGPANDHGVPATAGDKETSGGNLSGRIGQDGSAGVSAFDHGTPGTLPTTQGASDAYTVREKTIHAYRLISQTYLANDTEEQTILNLMPLITNRVMRSHARALENMVINGDSGKSIKGFIAGTADTGFTGTRKVDNVAGAGKALQAKDLMSARKLLGIYGLDPSDVTYIVPVDGFYDLIQDDAFTDMDKVGSLATKIQGMIGMLYGSPVIISDALPYTPSTSDTAMGLAVNPSNYIIPMLKGLSLETDYEVGNQRRVIVAAQSTGFEDLVVGAAASARVIAA